MKLMRLRKIISDSQHWSKVSSIEKSISLNRFESVLFFVISAIPMCLFIWVLVLLSNSDIDMSETGFGIVIVFIFCIACIGAIYDFLKRITIRRKTIKAFEKYIKENDIRN